MSYWSQTDLEGLIGKAAVAAIYDDDRNGFVNAATLAETQALADSEVDGAIATEYPGVNLPIFQSIPTWIANTTYGVGAMVLPTAPNGYAFRCVGVSGKSSVAQPTWPAQYGVTVADGTVLWLCVSTVPELIRHASLLWGRALAYERSPEYTKRYGAAPRKAAQEYLQRLVGAKRYLTDLLGGQLPSNVGGVAVDNAQRLYCDSADGTPNSGDY
jgi:hypothetical protein